MSWSAVNKSIDDIRRENSGYASWRWGGRRVFLGIRRSLVGESALFIQVDSTERFSGDYVEVEVPVSCDNRTIIKAGLRVFREAQRLEPIWALRSLEE